MLSGQKFQEWTPRTKAIAVVLFRFLRAILIKSRIPGRHPGKRSTVSSSGVGLRKGRTRVKFEEPRGCLFSEKVVHTCDAEHFYCTSFFLYHPSFLPLSLTQVSSCPQRFLCVQYVVRHVDAKLAVSGRCDVPTVFSQRERPTASQTTSDQVRSCHATRRPLSVLLLSEPILLWGLPCPAWRVCECAWVCTSG